jgi:Sulfotransferase domain
MARTHRVTQIWQHRTISNLRHSMSPRRLYRLATANHRSLPDFLIVGAQKAGTTSLWSYLNDHPNVDPCIVQETGFFDKHFQRGTQWYRMHFPVANRKCNGEGPAARRITGESTAHYMLHPLAAERMAQVVPTAKIIVLLRNPVDRAFSHYQMKVRVRQEPLPFEDAIEAETERLDGEMEKILADTTYRSSTFGRYSYSARGIYVDQIRRLQQYFPAEQLLVLESGRFFKHTAQVFQQVLDFLGIPRWEHPGFGNRFPGRYQEKMSEATRRKLLDFFAPHNERLFAHLGVRFDWDR